MWFRLEGAKDRKTGTRHAKRVRSRYDLVGLLSPSFSEGFGEVAGGVLMPTREDAVLIAAAVPANAGENR